jgi:hypothetical protein
MASRSDDDYWNDKYSDEPECEVHGDANMAYEDGEWVCIECAYDDEIKDIYDGRS